MSAETELENKAQSMKIPLHHIVIMALGSLLYAVGTIYFIFPHSLLLGGTSGIAVILGSFLPLTPGNFSVMINTTLIVLAFVILGKGAAVRTLIGSGFTTLFIGLVDAAYDLQEPLVSSVFLSSIIGAVLIAIAGGVLFYMGSSSGGTDIVALIVKKYVDIYIGRALLVTDILIVIIGGLLSTPAIAISSFVGLLIKTLGIDVVIQIIHRTLNRKA